MARFCVWNIEYFEMKHGQNMQLFFLTLKAIFLAMIFKSLVFLYEVYVLNVFLKEVFNNINLSHPYVKIEE